MEPIFRTWPTDLLSLFLQIRSIPLPPQTQSQPQSQSTHAQLAALATQSFHHPIVPIPHTPPSILTLFTLPHLHYYLTRRGHAVNAMARWARAAPPNLGRQKREALLSFAQEEYAQKIRGDEEAMRRFDEDVAETLRQRIVVVAELTDDEVVNFRAPYLADDDLEVLCETLGFERYVRHERAETLKRAQETLDILSGNKQ